MFMIFKAQNLDKKKMAVKCYREKILRKWIRENGAGGLGKASEMSKLTDDRKQTFPEEGKSSSHMLFSECSERETHPSRSGEEQEEQNGGPGRVGDEIGEGFCPWEHNRESTEGSEQGCAGIQLSE